MATIDGLPSNYVAWRVMEYKGGIVNGPGKGHGVYTAPSTGGIYHVEAMSLEDESIRAVAIVIVAQMTITISPATISLAAGEVHAFTAKVAGSVETTVCWSVMEPYGGRIGYSSGTYTAPIRPGTYHIVAEGKVDPVVKAVALVKVSEVGVKIGPTAVSVIAKGWVPFSVTVTGAVDTDVFWSVLEKDGGSITRAGDYTAPGKPGTYHVVATAKADLTVRALATITVTQVAIELAPSTVCLALGQGCVFRAMVMGGADSRVTWSVLESDGGFVDGSGAYVAPLKAGTYHLVARASADPAVQATALVVVKNVKIGIDPPAVTLIAGISQFFVPTLIGEADVIWSVQEADGGSVNDVGLYVAPMKAGLYHVTAKAGTDPTFEAVALVEVIMAPVVVTIRPLTAYLAPGGGKVFATMVTGTANTAVTWTASGGRVLEDGAYSAPLIAGTYQVTATSQVDSTKLGIATVAVGVPPVIISFTAGPSNISEGSSTILSWTVSGAETITLDPDIGDVSNQTLKKTTPNRSATYTLTASNSMGTVSKAIDVAVRSGP